LVLYLPISCFSVANALTTCTPAMFSAMIETFLSSASMTALAAGWTVRLNRRMYHVQNGSGRRLSSASHGLRVRIRTMYPATIRTISRLVSSAVWTNERTFWRSLSARLMSCPVLIASWNPNPTRWSLSYTASRRWNTIVMLIFMFATSRR
jgi:hypothetical protein